MRTRLEVLSSAVGMRNRSSGRAAAALVGALVGIGFLMVAFTQAENATYTQRLAFGVPTEPEFDFPFAAPGRNVGYTREVVERASNRSDEDLTPAEVVEAVEVHATEASQSVAIMATGDSPAEARELAEAFALPFASYRRRVLLERAESIAGSARRRVAELRREKRSGREDATSVRVRARALARKVEESRRLLSWLDDGYPWLFPRESTSEG